MILFPLFALRACAQRDVADQSVRYQEERMVYLQWDQNKFTPTSGFLGLNPYYWLTWGLFEPNYHKTDLRPLSATGPQTQRLALVGTMNSVDNSYKLNADTVRNTALTSIAEQSGLLSDADPLWLLYYSQALAPVLNYSDASILAPLTAQVRNAVISEGLLPWYENELAMLKERINAARSTDMDRGSRIMAYYRYLKEYRTLAATWATRVATAQKNITMVKQQTMAKGSPVITSGWTPDTDVQLARQVLANKKY
ncbi:hypothetical protein RG47T_4273 [Mucilaginibacter polytrichastri]|uniref:DUF5045 domain-containing protein n=2 Tax=Mucilaginibacter polytrichastri TaxID=1302689 RepID=A0A1Q6A458_9SPHI|nr:hypothetical protein RG47T_4273 [Mucilaginibacter polytrichastri]SFT05744.1 hypothetical protein SAMN04487890_109127 [Mucilaginibacter polytrichastri]